MAPRTILVIEDDEDARLLMRTALQHAGYRVLEAPDGGSGVEIAREHLPDLVVTDLQMPVLDGWETARRLKADPKTRDLPLVAVTGHTLTSEEGRGYERLFRAVLLKPLDPSDLVLVARGFMEASRS